MTAVPLTNLLTDKMTKDTKEENKKKMKKEKKKKEKKKRKRQHDDQTDETPETNPPLEERSDKTDTMMKEESNEDADGEKISSKDKHKTRKEEKAKLMEQVPKVDQDGIAYTKQQIRRMMRRVKKGLTPIPTAQEEQQLKREEAKQRREEEALYHDDGVREQAKEAEDERSAVDANRTAIYAEKEKDNEPANTDAQVRDKTPLKKKKKRSKPVPSDYICQACQNKHSPLHWIYDCPDKITRRGSNQVSKKERGVKQPDDHKVFVSGLPFDIKPQTLKLYLKDCGKVEHCKLLTFEDTGRCKGQAFVTFDSLEGAKKALKMSGTVIEQGKDATKTKKELRLKVTKVLNRLVTKNKSNN